MHREKGTRMGEYRRAKERKKNTNGRIQGHANARGRKGGKGYATEFGGTSHILVVTHIRSGRHINGR